MPINIMIFYLNCLLFMYCFMLSMPDMLRHKHLFILQRNGSFVHNKFNN